MILIIKHVPLEGPGTIADFLRGEGFQCNEINLYEDNRLPRDLTNVEAIICMGGPMNVYEEDKYPFLKEEDGFLKRAVKEEIPFLGICLGSQLLAKACGAQVKKAKTKELGWSMVELTEEGKYDSLFKGLGDFLAVFQWHEDTFDLPEGGELLSTSGACAHQAFRVGKNAYGLQYHIEVTQDIIEDWIKDNFKVKEAQQCAEGRQMIKQYVQLKEQFSQQAQQMYRNFVAIIRKARPLVTRA